MKIDSIDLIHAFDHATISNPDDYEEITENLKEMFSNETKPLYILPESKLENYLAFRNMAEAHRADVMELLHVFKDITNMTSGKGMTGIIKMFTTNAKPLESFAARINAVAEKYVTPQQKEDGKA